MPWNDNKGGGGGWNPGGGGRGPWGQGPNGGGGRGQGPNIRPPDLDELFKRAREWLARMFPKQSPGAVVFVIAGAILLTLWVFTGVYQIQPAEQGIVLRFGAFVDRLGPGLHIRLPYPIEVVMRPNVEKENQINVGFRTDGDSSNSTPVADIPQESMMLTGDENIVDIDFAVFWKVADAERFLFEVDKVDETIKAVAESAMREAVGQARIDSIQTEGRAEVQDKVRKLMQATLDSYKAGVTITRVTLQKVDPPSQVIDAFRDVKAARQDQEKKRNEAQRYANTIVPQARGDAAKIEQDAEAFKQQAIAESQGEAQRFLTILLQYQGARGVTRERMYLETMQKVLGNTNKIIIESKSGVVQYLPLPELRRTTPAANATGGN